jgi:hypothetical protein
MVCHIFRPHAATLQCALAPWQFLLGRWPDEDVVIRGLEKDVYAMSQIPQRAWLSDIWEQVEGLDASLGLKEIRGEKVAATGQASPELITS